MRVAIAGASNFAKYFIDELPRAGIEIVLLTRSHKPGFDGKSLLIEQRITDYKDIDKLTEQINDCDALLSTVSVALTQAKADAQIALIEACKRSLKCKRFIPSEFSGNTEEFPEPPDSMYRFDAMVKDALKAQNEIEWSVVSISWCSDYLVPSANRYHRDLPPAFFPIDFANKTMKIPGTGHEKFAITSARDVARATAGLLKSPNKWRNFTYVQAEETSWLEVAEIMRTVGGIPDLEVSFESVDELKSILERKESVEAAILAEFKLLIPSGIMKFDQEKVRRDREEFFPTLHMRTAKELFEEIKANPSVIV